MNRILGAIVWTVLATALVIERHRKRRENRDAR